VNAQPWSTLAENFSGVTSLSISTIAQDFVFNDANSFARMVCAFPRLRELRMRCTVRSTLTVVASEAELPSATTFRLSADFHSLDIGYDGIGAVLEWLLSLSAPPALRTVRLTDIKDGDLAALHKFIRILGEGLESFTVSASVQDCMRMFDWMSVFRAYEG
jgi:hypothetical protein